MLVQHIHIFTDNTSKQWQTIARQGASESFVELFVDYCFDFVPILTILNFS